VGDRKGVKKIKTEKAFFLLCKHKTARSPKNESFLFFLLTRIIPPPPLFPFQQRQARTKIKSRKRKRKQSRNVLKRLQKKDEYNQRNQSYNDKRRGGKRNYISTQSKRERERIFQNTFCAYMAEESSCP